MDTVYAILDINGKQYKVATKDVITVEKLNSKPADKVVWENVLLFSDGEKTEIGQPYLKGYSVEAEVLSQAKTKKLLIFKFRRRKNMRLTKGHRQLFTKLLIKKITKPKA